MKRTVVLLSCLFSFSSHSGQAQQPLTVPSTYEKVIIDVMNAEESSVALETILFGKMEVIKLESNPNSYLADITKVIFAKERFYVLDSSLGNLLVFDKSGNFLFKIGNRGDGPGEHVGIVDFTIDKSRGLVGLLSLSSSQVHFFDLDGKFKESQKLNYQASKLVSLGDGKVAYFLTYFDKSLKNFKMTNSKGEVIYEHFDFPQHTFRLGLYNITGLLTANNEGVLYSDATSPIIHQITENGTTYPKYEFKLGKNAWPEEDKYLIKLFFDKIQKGQTSYLTSFYRESNDYLVAEINSSVPEGSKVIVDFSKVVYDKHKKKVYLLADKVSKSMSGPLGYDLNLGFISSISHDKLMGLMETEIGNKVLSLSNDQRITDKGEEQNPSIILYSFKKK